MIQPETYCFINGSKVWFISRVDKVEDCMLGDAAEALPEQADCHGTRHGSPFDGRPFSLKIHH